MQAVYACDPAQSRGRLFDEAPSAHRSAFQRDRDRIIHATAFRRLKHKTQVFVEHEGDHFRTRLTHSLEVAQVARVIAKILGANEELTEAVALAHDLGHPPFGHTGEEALDEMMRAWGGFDHNAQAIRIVTHLEQHYAAFDGLNLSWETLEGIAKHNGPLIAPGMPPLPKALAAYTVRHDLQLATYASLEAQVAAIADDIAYNNHDLDDGLRAGLFRMEDVEEMALVAPHRAEVDALWPGLAPERRRHEIVRRIFGHLVEDVIVQTQKEIARGGFANADEIRGYHKQIVDFSETVKADLRVLRVFLFENMYRHKKVKEMRRETAQVVRDLFRAFEQGRLVLPEAMRAACAQSDAATKAEAIADYIAGMTDRFALTLHGTLRG